MLGKVGSNSLNSVRIAPLGPGFKGRVKAAIAKAAQADRGGFECSSCTWQARRWGELPRNLIVRQKSVQIQLDMPLIDVVEALHARALIVVAIRKHDDIALAYFTARTQIPPAMDEIRAAKNSHGAPIAVIPEPDEVDAWHFTPR